MDEIEWLDENNNLQTLNCYYENEEGEFVSKGLLKIAKELKLVRENQTVKLDDLKEICKKHAAFKETTKLEEVAAKYPNIKIIFVPKFHCELSPIKGVWAFSKNRNRRYNDLSSFNNYIDLLNETKQIIKEHV